MMKLSTSSSIILTTALIGLSSCATTPTALKMHKANSMLRQSARKAKQGDFEKANAAAASIGLSVRQGVELSPIIQTKAGQEIDLTPMLNAWESGPYKDLRKALKNAQGKSATTAFTNLRGQCTNCHAVIGRPTIQIN